MLVSASWDSTVKVWRVDQTSNKLSFRFELMEHETEITCLALDPAGTWAATGGSDGAVMVWNVDGNMTAGQGCLAAKLVCLPHEAARTLNLTLTPCCVHGQPSSLPLRTRPCNDMPRLLCLLCLLWGLRHL